MEDPEVIKLRLVHVFRAASPEPEDPCGNPACQKTYQWHLTTLSVEEIERIWLGFIQPDTEEDTTSTAGSEEIPTTSTSTVSQPANVQSEEVRTTSSTGAQKGVKPDQQSLIPVPALQLLGRLYGKGAEKYAKHNWRKGYEWSKSYDAAMRHMQLFWDGEDIDPEMGLPHVTCATFHMMAIATFMIEHPEFDDRFKRDRNMAEFSYQLDNPIRPRDIPGDMRYPFGGEERAHSGD